MATERDQIFNISSIGNVYRKSLAIFAHHLEDSDGDEIQLDYLAVDQPFFVIFKGGTGLTRTSAVRIA
jgi:hypothetical protein